MSCTGAIFQHLFCICHKTAPESAATDAKLYDQRVIADLQQQKEVGTLTRRKVLCLPSLVRPHNRQPPLPIDIVAPNWRLALLERLDRPFRNQTHAQAGRGAEALLRGGNDNVQTPIVESDFLGRDRADGVEGDERVGRVLFDERGDVRGGREDAGGGVNWG